MTATMTLPPGDAVNAAVAEAERIADGAAYRFIAADALQLLYVQDAITEWIGEARAVVVCHKSKSTEGYAVHQVCERGVGAIATRIYVEAAR